MMKKKKKEEGGKIAKAMHVILNRTALESMTPQTIVLRR
jgi:hypothetical protein